MARAIAGEAPPEAAGELWAAEPAKGLERAGEAPLGLRGLERDWRAVAFGAAAVAQIGKSRLGIDFCRAQQATLSVPCGRGDAHVEVAQDAQHKLLGAVVWDCGLVMVRVLALLAPSLLARARVLELGSGTGLCGLAAARLGARHVVLTDLEGLLPALLANVERNTAHLRGLGPLDVQARAFEWGSDLASLGGPFDLVVASDVLYDRKHHAGLLATVRGLAEAGASVLLAVKLRFPDDERAFFARLDAELDLELWAMRPCGELDPSALGVAVLLLRRRTGAQG